MATDPLIYWPLMAQLKHWKYYRYIRCFTMLDLNQKNVILITKQSPGDEDWQLVDDQVWAFGENRFGILGVGHCSSCLKVPVKIRKLCNRKVQQIVQGTNHVVALCADGTLMAWGANYNGQLGHDNLKTCLSPKRLFCHNTLLERFVGVTCGQSHTIALTDCGQVVGCGSNQYGELVNTSINTNQTSLETIYCNGIRMKSVESGHRHTLALTTDGLSVYAWGRNNRGQLGIGHYRKVQNLIRMKLPMLGRRRRRRQQQRRGCHQNGDQSTRPCGDDVIRCIAIAAGNEHSLILTNQGTIYGCGDNSFGQLALPLRKDCPNPNSSEYWTFNEHVTSSAIPVSIGDIRFKSIAAHENLSVALSVDGFCYVWGETSLNILESKSTLINQSQILKTPLICMDQTIAIYSKQQIRTRSMIQVNGGSMNKKQNFNETNPIQQKLLQMFNNPLKSDVKFVVNGLVDSPIYAHRWFLMLVSPYYRRLLSARWHTVGPKNCDSSMDYSDDTIFIGGSSGDNDFNYSYETYLANFRWIYTGQIDRKLTDCQLIELLDLATCLLDSELMDRCAKVLGHDRLTLENYQQLYQLAEQYELDKLRDLIDQFVLDNLPKKSIRPICANRFQNQSNGKPVENKFIRC